MPAQIIPFPLRQSRAGSPQDTRLRDSLARLQTASDQQRHAIAGWRQALSELRASMLTLDDSMQRYRLRLETLRAGLDGVRDQSRRLEAQADRAGKN